MTMWSGQTNKVHQSPVEKIEAPLETKPVFTPATPKLEEETETSDEEESKLQLEGLHAKQPSSQDRIRVFEVTRIKGSKFKLPDGSEISFKDLPPGAVFQAEPRSGKPKGSDGKSLYVRLPNGDDWNIDGRASNCDRTSDNVHRCWVRHGSASTGDLTVDKNGLTCSAGASISVPGYHGFLQNGFLVPAFPASQE